MKAYFEQNSPILEPGRLNDALSGALDKSLPEFDAEVKKHQLNGEHTGVVRNVRINGGVVRHQSSRIGESPAVLRGGLVNSNVVEKLSPVKAQLTVTAPHGAILVNKLKRDVLETPEKEYAPRFRQNVADAVGELL
jgi:hypothetical protein